MKNYIKQPSKDLKISSDVQEMKSTDTMIVRLLYSWKKISEALLKESGESLAAYYLGKVMEVAEEWAVDAEPVERRTE